MSELYSCFMHGDHAEEQCPKCSPAAPTEATQAEQLCTHCKKQITFDPVSGFWLSGKGIRNICEVYPRAHEPVTTSQTDAAPIYRKNGIEITSPPITEAESAHAQELKAGVAPTATEGAREPEACLICDGIDKCSDCQTEADWKALHDEIAKLRAELAALPANWLEDSSLETWFPLTAEELKRTKAELEQVRRERDQWQTLFYESEEYNCSCNIVDKSQPLGDTLNYVCDWHQRNPHIAEARDKVLTLAQSIETLTQERDEALAAAQSSMRQYLNEQECRVKNQDNLRAAERERDAADKRADENWSLYESAERERDAQEQVLITALAEVTRLTDDLKLKDKALRELMEFAKRQGWVHVAIQQAEAALSPGLDSSEAESATPSPGQRAQGLSLGLKVKGNPTCHVCVIEMMKVTCAKLPEEVTVCTYFRCPAWVGDFYLPDPTPANKAKADMDKLAEWNRVYGRRGASQPGESQ